MTIIANVTKVSGVRIEVFLNESFIINATIALHTCWLEGRGPVVYTIKKIGRFFSVLPQRTARPYTLKSKFIKYDSRGEEV